MKHVYAYILIFVDDIARVILFFFFFFFLQPLEGDPHSDFINASFIDVSSVC